MGRRFSLTLQATRGKLSELSATIGGRLVLGGDALEPRTYCTDQLPDEPVEVRVIATGVVGARYAIAAALPSKEQGFVRRYTLTAPVQSVAFRV